MLPYIIIAPVWLAAAVVWPLVQSLHTLQKKGTEAIEEKKMWLFYWACLMCGSVFLHYFEWIVRLPFYVVSWYIDLYYEAHLVLALLLVMPRTLLIKRVFDKLRDPGSGSLDSLCVIVWNLVLLGLMLPTNFLLAAVGSFIVGKMGKSSRANAEQFLNQATIGVTCLVWRLATALCVWVSYEGEGLEDFRSRLNASGKPAVLLPNHVSFMDIILSVALTPIAGVAKVKMMVSDHVFKMPCIGTIARAMGHLSIPFKSQDADSFAVDKEAVEKNLQIMEKHIVDGGNVGWFPEGRINPGEPTKLSMFRAGGFSVAVKHDVEIWCLAFVGNSVFWPKKAKVGGHPCRIGFKIFQLCESTQSYCAQAPVASGKDAERAKCEFLANQAQGKMQEAIDSLVAKGFTGGPPPTPSEKKAA